MPELPEVELTGRALNRWTRGRRVEAIDVHDAKHFEGDPDTLVGRTFTRWERRAKYLVARFDGPDVLLAHLGMTGKWVEDPGPERSHQRVVVHLEPDVPPTTVAFIDPRRFGGCWVLPAAALDAHPRLAELGPDPTASDFDGPALAAACGRGRAPLKARLLDQRRLGGLGNIAVSEVAWRARVHPHAPVDLVTPRTWEALSEAIHAHVAHVLDVEGDGEIRYQSESAADNPFLVYGREGEPCPRCAAPLVRTVLAGRSSFWCPACQPEPT